MSLNLKRATRALNATIMGEILLGVSVLSMTATISYEVPPRSLQSTPGPASDTQATVSSHGITSVIALHSLGNGEHSMTAAFSDASGAPLKPNEVLTVPGD
jgi:hypothetical protein